MVGAGEGDTEEQVTDGQGPGEKYMTGTSTALGYPPPSGTKIKPQNCMQLVVMP